MSDNRAEAAKLQTDLETNRDQAREATKAALREVEHKDPQFLKQLQDLGLDSEKYGWLLEEFPVLSSDTQILGNREEDYTRRRELFLYNKIERMEAMRRPGRLLRENPELLRIAQGVHRRDDKDLRRRMHPDDREVMYEFADVEVTRESLSVEGKGVDAAANVTVENQNIKTETETSSSVVEKAKGVFN